MEITKKGRVEFYLKFIYNIKIQSNSYDAQDLHPQDIMLSRLK